LVVKVREPKVRLSLDGRVLEAEEDQI